MPQPAERRALMLFVIRLGLVSLFADFTYEGGRGIMGSYLAMLGATPLLVGLVSGGGEMVGYAVRWFSGRYADRTRRYWPIMSVGYGLNLFAVPALALTTALGPAVALMFGERVGKGIRNPARNVILSQAGERYGHGQAFGIHELLDQTGGFLGPLTVAGLVALSSYRVAFAVLLLPALIALLLLRRAYRHAPTPQARPSARVTMTRLPPLYFRYMAFAALTVMGFTHFILFSYHLAVSHRVAPPWIPALYALAMASSGLAALPAGKLFDRVGLKILYAVPLLILATNPLLFLARTPALIVAGTIVWGVALGIQQSVMRAGVAQLSPQERRGAAFGLFDAGFGFAWMIGSIVMGWLYSLAAQDLVVFASGAEVASLALLPWILRDAPASRA